MESDQQPVSMYSDYEIDLREVFRVLWAGRLLIFVVTATAAIITVIITLNMTDMYRAEIMLAPADTEQVGGLMGQLGGAAALLGVTGGSNSGDNISTAIATLRSRQFIGRFIEKHEMTVPLFAASWDKKNRKSVIDTEIYNPVNAEWLGDGGQPTQPNAIRAFLNLLSITGPNRDSGIVTVSIEWHNPEEAAEWINLLIRDLNQELRERDVREANSAIQYLRRQLNSTQLVDMQRVFYQLIESQTRITMLADVREEYVFRVIDPAVVPDRKSGPRRALICILGTMGGGILSLLLVLVRRIFTKYYGRLSI